MPARGKTNNNTGRGGTSPRGGSFRGQGPNRARGGRGRGGKRGGRGRGTVGLYRNLEELNFQVQIYTDVATPSRGSPVPRGRGRGIEDSAAGMNWQTRMHGSPRGRGSDSGRATLPRRGFGRGRERGSGFNNRHNSDVPLSRMLDLDRPLLRPIVFVPAQFTPILFQEEEEIFQASQETLDGDHAPTAARVARVFSGQGAPPENQFETEDDDPDDAEDSNANETLATIEFNSLAEFLESSGINGVAELPQGDIILQTKALHIPQESRSVQSIDEASVAHNVNLPSVDAHMSNAAESAQAIAAPATPCPENVLVLEHQDDEPTVEVLSSQSAVVSLTASNTLQALSMTNELLPSFVIDVNPTRLSDKRKSDIAIDRVSYPPLGSEAQEDDEVIVYVAPHPRQGRATATIPNLGTMRPMTPSTLLSRPSSILRAGPITQPSPPKSPSFASLSMSFDSIAASASRNREVKQAVASPRSRRLTKKARQIARRRIERGAMFGSFGAMMEESQLRGGARTKSRDPRRDEQRRGDSDVDWGDEAEEQDAQDGEADGGIDEVSSGIGAMDLDPDLDVDPVAFRNFAQGMVNAVHVTMDDIADMERIKLEDEEDETSTASKGSSHGDDEEIQEVLEGEERLLIAEMEETAGRVVDASGDEGEEENTGDDDSSSDEEITPKRGFQARLAKIRQNAKGKTRASAEISSEDDDSSDEGPLHRNGTWAEKDDDYIAEIQAILEKNEHILGSRDRKQKKALFRAIQDGDFDNGEFDDGEILGPAERRKDKSVPAHLQEQWDKDRVKKAENKRLRALERTEAAADPFARHKKGKKGRKRMLKASALDSDIDLPHRVVDFPSLVTQIRAFVANIGGRSTMSLPPMEKDTRAEVHKLALAFNLQSKSLGKGKARYTTLTKTSRTGYNIDEQKVGNIVRKSADGGGFSRPYDRGGGGKGNNAQMPKHRDGDEVGKAAPKIGEGNVGFKMLASMGWSSGDRIGISGGLDAPLTAIIKNTKLGLGHLGAR